MNYDENIILRGIGKKDMGDFLQRNTDAIIIVIISVTLSFLLNNFIKIITTLKNNIRKIKKRVKRFIRKTIYGEYTLNDIMVIQSIPKEQRTKKQQKALEKAQSQIASAIDADKMNEFVERMNSIGNEIGRFKM